MATTLDDAANRLVVALSELDAALDLRRATLVHVTEARQLVNEALGMILAATELDGT